MSPEPTRPRPQAASRPPRRPGSDGLGGGRDEIQEAYLNRAIAEISELQDEIGACPGCRAAGVMPVLASGSPQAEIMLVKPAAGLAERQEGVAFFGRAGTAVLKSVQRLGIDPLTLYGTLAVKCTHPDPDHAAQLRWLAAEVRILDPKIVVPMGEPALEALNRLDLPMAAPLKPRPGVLQRWTPASEALLVPDLDESLDEQAAKRAFWDAFRALGEWHQAQAPF
jgi:uracil-DNA glycosylase family 4